MAANTKEIGRAGLDAWMGIIREDFIKELRGREGYKRYDEMRRNSPIIGSLLQAVYQSVLSIQFQFTSEEGNEDPRLELLNESLESMSHSLRDHIGEALTFLPFGFSLFEIVYQRVGGKMLWRKFAPRGQDTIRRWGFDDTGGIQGAFQAVVGRDEQFLPIKKLILYRTNVERNNPEGRSVLRTAWIPYYFAKNIMQIEAIGIERDLAGLPMIHLPQDADTSDESNSDKSKAEKMVRNIRNDEQAGLVIPYDWEFELVTTGGSRAHDTDKVVRRYESRMLMSALAQFLMLGQENVGSLALSKDQTDFFTMSVNTVADILTETITHHAIPRLMRLNGLDDAGLALEHSPAGDIDLGTIADFLQKTGSMISWTAEDEIWLRQVAQLPEKTAEEIDEERERKRAENPLKDFLPQLNQPREEQGATLFDAAPPDDEERRLFEGRWTRLWRKLFGEQKKSILERVRGDELSAEREDMNADQVFGMIERLAATMKADPITIRADKMTVEQHPSIEVRNEVVPTPLTVENKIGQPVNYVMVPEQKAPKVDVHVDPTPIDVNVAAPAVTNEVKVPRLVRSKETQKVKRDSRGQLSGSASETEYEYKE